MDSGNLPRDTLGIDEGVCVVSDNMSFLET